MQQISAVVLQNLFIYFIFAKAIRRIDECVHFAEYKIW